MQDKVYKSYLKARDIYIILYVKIIDIHEMQQTNQIIQLRIQLEI